MDNLHLQPIRAKTVLRGSYSSWFKNLCARKFILRRIKGQETGVTHHTSFGYAWEEGVSQIIMGNGLDYAIYRALLTLNWGMEKPPKSIQNLVLGLESFDKQWARQDLEIINIQGRPAYQIGFKILLDPPKAHSLVGFIDLILSDSEGNLSAVECKSTSFNAGMIDQLYSHDPQYALYSLVAQSITKSPSLNSLYIVCSCAHTGYPIITIKPYKTTVLKRIEALTELKALYQRYLSYLQLGVWPQNGNDCRNTYGLCPYWFDCGFEWNHIIKENNREYDPEIDDWINLDNKEEGKYAIITTYNDLTNNLARYV